MWSFLFLSLILPTLQWGNVLPQWSQENHYSKRGCSVHAMWAEMCEGWGPDPPRPLCQRPLKFKPPFLSDGWILFLATLTFGVCEDHDRNQAGWFFHICSGRGYCEIRCLKTLQLDFMLDPFLDGVELGWTATQPNTRQAVSKTTAVWDFRGGIRGITLDCGLCSRHGVCSSCLCGDRHVRACTGVCVKKMQPILSETIFGHNQGPHTSVSPYSLGMMGPTTTRAS